MSIINKFKLLQNKGYSAKKAPHRGANLCINASYMYASINIRDALIAAECREVNTPVHGHTAQRSDK